MKTQELNTEDYIYAMVVIGVITVCIQAFFVYCCIAVFCRKKCPCDTKCPCDSNQDPEKTLSSINNDTTREETVNDEVLEIENSSFANEKKEKIRKVKSSKATKISKRTETRINDNNKKASGQSVGKKQQRKTPAKEHIRVLVEREIGS